MRLPSFIGVGPGRTGTTWLHYALAGVAGLPSVKETRFFREHYHKGVEWYASHFRDCLDSVPVGEICPYFGSAEAIERIYSYIPNCKIICTFREPADRAYSHYKLMRRLAVTRKSFDETLATESWWEGNRYAFYLEKWQERFGAQQVLVTLYDDLINEPQAHLDRICNFIGAKRVVLAERQFPPHARNHVELQPKNVRLARAARIVRSWLEKHEVSLVLRVLRRSGAFAYCFERGQPFPELESEVDARARERFRPEVDALEEMIGRDLSAWKQPRAVSPRAPS
jgi:hypothetical protein